MHDEILKKEQTELLPILKMFSKNYFLVGGTAIALHIGHRYSVDFDLFTFSSIKKRSIKSLLQKENYNIQHILFEDSIQLHCIINNVKLTFFQFPYKINAFINYKNIIKTPDLLTLAAMKAYALGGRSKWKDYVDLYFIFKNYFSFYEVVAKANELFETAFNDKLFRQQLAYFDDISFEEEVEYVNEIAQEDEIKQFLTEIALTKF